MKEIRVDDHKNNTFLRNVAIGVILLLVFLTLPNLCGAHGDHGHSHDEPAGFKYSREANEQFLKEQHDHHAAHHGHAHGGHGHDDHHHGHAHHETKTKDLGMYLLYRVNFFLIFDVPVSRYVERMGTFNCFNITH